MSTSGNDEMTGTPFIKKESADTSAVETIVIGKKKRQAQAVFCKCKSLVAACMAPHCFEDKEWQKDIRQFSKDGYEIRMVDPEEVRLTLTSCKYEEEQVSLAL